MSKCKKPNTDGRARKLRWRLARQAMEQAIEEAERSFDREQTKPRATMVCDPGWLRRLPK